MNIAVRVVRQFQGAVTLEKTLVLPDVPTMGTRLDLRADGVESPLTVVGVTLRPVSTEPSVEVILLVEPLSAARLARTRGWREPSSVEPPKA